MKRILIICAILFSVVTFSKAQGGRMGTPAERAQRQIDQLTTRLKLTDDQKTKVSALVLAQANSQDSLMKAANGDFSAMREKMAPLTASTDSKIQALLTPEQKPEFEAYVKERASRMGGGGAR